MRRGKQNGASEKGNPCGFIYSMEGCIAKGLIVKELRGLFMIQKRIESSGKYQVCWAKNLAEARDILDQPDNDFFASLLDFNLPDAPNGEIIDTVVARQIPAIIFTAYVSEEIRQKVWSFNVVDYVLKEDVLSLEYIVSLLTSLEKNHKTKILVANNDADDRQSIASLLKVHHYQVLATDSGKDALHLLAEHPETRLVIAAPELQDMDGLTLIQKIRRIFPKEELAIMGLVAKGEHIMAARFLKYGAHHFIVRETFLPEEFYCSVRLLIENIEHFLQLRSTALQDFLTGLHNRRYFFITGEKLFASAKRNNVTLVCAMLDIDFFKKVNDQHGHEAGDQVLKHIALILKNRMRKTDIVARLGGEEFCILAVNMAPEAVRDIFEEIRKRIEDSEVLLDEGATRIKVTISIGVTTQITDSLENMIKKADFLLYDAKESGRNRVVAEV